MSSDQQNHETTHAATTNDSTASTTATESTPQTITSSTPVEDLPSVQSADQGHEPASAAASPAVASSTASSSPTDNATTVTTAAAAAEAPTQVSTSSGITSTVDQHQAAPQRVKEHQQRSTDIKRSASMLTPSSTSAAAVGHHQISRGGGQLQAGAATPKKTVSQRLQGALGRLVGKTPKDKTPSSAATATKDKAPPSAPNVHTLSPQDQKLLAIMRERKAAEEREKEEREKKHSEWEQENRRLRQASAAASGGSAAGSRTAAAQRYSIGGGRGLARPQLASVTSDQSDSSVFDTSLASPLATSTLQRLATPDTPTGGVTNNNSAENSRRTSICSSVSSLADGRLYDPVRNRQLQNMEKRRTVEQRLEQQRKEMEEHARQLKLKQEQDFQRANSLRLSREQQQAMRARLANEKVQQKRELIAKQKQQSQNDLSALQESIDAKLTAAEQKVQRLREEENQRNRSELQKRLELSRQKQREMEAELEVWRQELIKFNQWQGDNAEKVAQQNKAMKSVNACKTRLEREKKQQENMKKLMTVEEKRLCEIEASIESKDSRTTALLKEKDEVVLRSRERAMATKQLRDELRAHYSMNDIDQLNRQVALEHRLLTKVPNSSQTSLNSSMLSLA